MQSIIILTVLIMFSLYALMQTRRNSTATSLPQLQAAMVAGNILQYADMATLYLRTNYDSRTLMRPGSPGKAEQIKLIDSGEISDYADLSLYMNYQTVSFNYSQGESLDLPTLYLAVSFNTYASGIVSHRLASLPEIMGMANQLLSKHLYQGNSVYWTTPWLLQQDNKCNVVEIFSQIPNDINGNSQLEEVSSWFNLLCRQIEGTGKYKFLTYVYLSSIILADK